MYMACFKSMIKEEGERRNRNDKGEKEERKRGRNIENAPGSAPIDRCLDMVA